MPTSKSSVLAALLHRLEKETQGLINMNASQSEIEAMSENPM